MPAVGKSVRRYEGPEKLTGQAKYIDDYKIPGCLFGVTLRSSKPHAKIKNICFDSKFPWHEFVFAKPSDIPGKNVVALIEDDQPMLADGIVRHREEPILLMAHADKATAYEALKHITIDYEPLPATLTLDEAMKDPNAKVFKKFLIEKGDVNAGFKKADVIVEETYKVPHQEQTYIENNGMAAHIEQDGTVVVMGSMQCPYYIHKALVKLFGHDKVRVIQTTTGGGFGGKEEFPSVIAGHVALLAWKARKPVKMIYDRHEDMAATTKRHPAVVTVKAGFKKDGTLVAQDIDVTMDGGAYATLSAVVLSRGTLHAAGPYECPNVRVSSRALQTHTPPNGAFRGFGAPQTLFPAELHMEAAAKALKMDSVALRRKNLFRKGSVTATGQILQESIGASDVLETTVKRSDYVKKRKAYDLWNKNPKNPTLKGIGLAVCHHGAGFTGSGEVKLASRAAVSREKDGTYLVRCANTEIGQGATTIFQQIASDALKVPLNKVKVQVPDTAKVPNSGPTVASRTTMVVGGLVARACEKLVKDKKLNWSEVEYEVPAGIKWDDDTYKGDAYGVYSYGAVAIDLEIDKTTFEVKVNKLTTAQDIGTAINPLLAEGQIIGGVTQALGYALLELPIYKDGVMINNQLTNYIIPTSLDTPPMDVTIVQKPYSKGPFGAKGVGELPMDIPGPAVAAAVLHATGKLVKELPILPETLCSRL
jgi:CO/xanthine dehydrogenase Mo-binding subunit